MSVTHYNERVEQHKIVGVDLYGHRIDILHDTHDSAIRHSHLLRDVEGACVHIVRIPPRIGHLTGNALVEAIADRYAKGGRLSAWTMPNEDGSSGYYPFQSHWDTEGMSVENHFETLPWQSIRPLFEAGVLSWPTGPDAKTFGWVRLDFNSLRPDLDLDAQTAAVDDRTDGPSPG